VSSKIERDFVASDLAAVDQLLGNLAPTDVFARLSLKSRSDELREKLRSLSEEQEVSASASLFFGGEPVLANRGIEASFGAQAMEKFQDVVSKIFAIQHSGSLGQRGIAPGKDASTLHVTNVVRGSFGFRLEELSPQGNMLESPLKDAVEEATRLMETFGEDDDEAFGSEVEDLDIRVLASVRDFFGIVSDHHATFRLLSGNIDTSFRAQAVARAAERARTTTVEEKDEEIPGQLSGALREARIFEFRTEDDRKTIRGSISVDLSADKISEINKTLADVNSTAKFSVKRVLQKGRMLREKFTLISIQKR